MLNGIAIDVLIIIGVLVVAGVIWKRKEKFTKHDLLTTNRLSDNSMQAGLNIKNTRALQLAVIGRTRY